MKTPRRGMASSGFMAAPCMKRDTECNAGNLAE